MYALKQVMAPKQPNTGLFVGLNKGHVVTKKELPPRPADRKGVSSFCAPKWYLFIVFVFLDLVLQIKYFAGIHFFYYVS